MKRLLLVVLHLIFPLKMIRRDIFGYTVVFLLLFIPLGGWKLITSEIIASEKPRIYGAVYDVPKFQWARILNQYGVRTEDFLLRRFEYCLVRYKGSVKEVTNYATWWSNWKGHVVVEYTNPGGHAATGVLCPSGTVFYVAGKELASFPDRFRERQLEEQKITQEVSQVRRKKQSGKVYELSKLFAWIEVVNPRGVHNFGYQISFLDICGIEAQGSAQVIGQTSFGALLEYTSPKHGEFLGIGIPCPANTLFFVENGRALAEVPSRPTGVVRQDLPMEQLLAAGMRLDRF